MKGRSVPDDVDVFRSIMIIKPTLASVSITIYDSPESNPTICVSTWVQICLDIYLVISQQSAIIAGRND